MNEAPGFGSSLRSAVQGVFRRAELHEASNHASFRHNDCGPDRQDSRSSSFRGLSSVVGPRQGRYRLLGGLLICLAAFVTGCRHAPEPFFPIGIYAPGSTNNFPLLKAVGFNTVVGPADRGFLDAAQRYGLKVLANPGTHAGPKFNPQQATRAVRTFDRHPALWSWYLADEPDMHGIPPWDVQAAHDWMKRAGARKPTSLVLYNGFEAPHYADIPDVLMIDRYPVPWAPLATFDQHVRLARHAAGQKKPLMAVLQAFDWSQYPEQMPEKVAMRPPTYEELRCMVYSALVQGANGLFFYPFDDGRWRQLEHPETWEPLQRVVAEVNERLPLFMGERLWWPWRQALSYGGKKHRNAAEESAVVLGHFRVPEWATDSRPAELLIAVNTLEEAVEIRLKSPWPDAQRLGMLGEGEAKVIVDGRLADRLAPYAVRVYFR